MPPAPQHGPKVYPVPLSARQRADLLLLVGALEVERGDIRPGVHLTPTDAEQVGPARDLLEHRVVGVEGVAALVDVRQVHRGTQFDDPLVGLFMAGDEPKESGLPGAVGTDDPHDGGRRHVEVQLIDEKAVSVALGDA